MDDQSTSPVLMVKSPDYLNFMDALKLILEGKRITKVEWNDKKIFGLLKDGFLTLHRDDKYHTWLVSEEDMRGTDWVELQESN